MIGSYIVESILSHHTDFEDVPLPDHNASRSTDPISQDETRYLVKWKGYDESEQTWELEDQFV